MTEPSITVESDYDGYFESLVLRWINEKAQVGEEFKSPSIIISAGPWRPYAVTYFRQDDGTLALDFYSALRTGFGELIDKDIDGIKALL